MEFKKGFFDTVCDYYFYPEEELLPPKTNPITRPTIEHAVPMILIATARVLRAYNNTKEYDGLIDIITSHTKYGECFLSMNIYNI